MKTLRWTMLVVVVVSLIVGLGFWAWSGPPIKPEIKVRICPQGWYRDPANVGSSESYICIPHIPSESEIACPTGWYYYKFGECAVGCRKAPR